MGITHVTTTLWNLSKTGTPFEGEFLVDTDAIDCLAPASALTAAGIEPEGKAIYELADGTPLEFAFGFARVVLLGDETVARVVFGPETAEPLVGVVALESLGMLVDPVGKTVRRMHAKPLK